MSSATARQWQRVDYRMPVQVTMQLGARNEPATLSAQAINVSEGGMQLRTAGPLPIGETVTCNLLLEGQRAALSGRVRWTKPTLPGIGAPGAGIQFDPLPDDESGLLRKAVLHAARGEQPIELYFAGVQEPVHARAFTSDAGIQITAALPVLTRDSDVEFKFGGKGPRFLGRIARVSVNEHERTPHIEVELAIHAREMPRFRRYTMYGGEESESATTFSTADKPARHSPTLHLWRPNEQSALEHAPIRTRTASEDAFPKLALGRLPRAALHGGVLLLGFALGALVASIAINPRGTRLPSTTRAQASAVALTQHHQEARVQPAPRAARAEAPEVSQRNEAQTQVNAEQPASKLEPRVLGVALPQPAPTLSVEGSITEVSVPVRGALDGMRSVVWASPRAVVVELPHATVPLQERRYVLALGGVDKLSILRSAEKTELRLFVDARVLRHALRSVDGQLVVRIERDLRELDAPH